MNALKIVCSMSEEHVKKCIKALTAIRAKDMEGAEAAMRIMTSEELDTFIALLDAAIAEGTVNEAV